MISSKIYMQSMVDTLSCLEVAIEYSLLCVCPQVIAHGYTNHEYD